MRVNRLTEAEHARVTEAVRAAEHGTDGEIVTIVTARSDAYHDVALHYAIGAMQIGRAHSELQSLMRISYAVFCLKKKKNTTNDNEETITPRQIGIAQRYH